MARLVLPGPLRDAAGGHRTIEIRGATVRAALDQLAVDLPALERRIRDERGVVREHVQIFVGATNVRDAQGQETPLPDNAELSVVPAISGGAPQVSAATSTRAS